MFRFYMSETIGLAIGLLGVFLHGFTLLTLIGGTFSVLSYLLSDDLRDQNYAKGFFGNNT